MTKSGFFVSSEFRETAEQEGDTNQLQGIDRFYAALPTTITIYILLECMWMLRSGPLFFEYGGSCSIHSSFIY